MNEIEVLSGMQTLFHDVFDDDSIVLHPETTADDIQDWDSQAHVQLVVAAETRFGVSFRTAELESLHNVGDFVRLIVAKMHGT